MLERFRLYWKNKQGLAAVEFAFVLPILLTMLLGLVELSQALLLRADVTNMSSTAADLIAQESSVSSSDLTNVFNALNAMVFPFDSTQTTITITSVIDGGTGNAPKIAWSCSQGKSPSALTKNAAVPSSDPLPSGLITAGDGTSVIWAKINYDYKSPIGYFLSGTSFTTWKNNFYLKPRRVLQVPITGTPTGCNT